MKTKAKSSSTSQNIKRTVRALALATAALLACRHAAADLVDPVNLGAASGFAVLAGSTITSTGSTTLYGDLGVWPGATVSETPAMTVNGMRHLNDAVSEAAQSALSVAFLDASGRTVSQMVATELGSTTLLAGVYRSAAGTFGITGNLTLDGNDDPNSVFIFQMASTLTTAASSQVNLVNGARADRIFWQVGSSATLGASSFLQGTILALTDISMGTSATVDGRALAQHGAVTLLGNTLTIPEPGTVLLLGAGLVLLRAYSRRRWSRAGATGPTAVG